MSAGASSPPDFLLTGVRVRLPGQRRDSAPILDDITLTIGRGEQVAVIGASGAGKSTLLAALAMAREPDAGTIAVFGTGPWTLSSRERHRQRRRLFLAPQVPPLPPRQRVVDAVLAGRLPQWGFWKSLASLAKAADAPGARDALAHFALEDRLFDRVDRLSGGERQRVALARMIASDAQVFLVDEPLSALDPTLAARSIAALQDVARERGATLVCSLHQVEIAQTRFPRLIGLRDGRILFDAPSEALDRGLFEALYEGSATPIAAGAQAVAAVAIDPHPSDVDAPLRVADGARL